MMLISVALKAGMEPVLLAAALRAIFLTGGAITIWLSYRYRQPYVMAFSLTGGLMWLSHYDRYPVGVVVAANLAGFQPDANRIMRWSGLGGLLSAPFRGFTPAMAAPLTGLGSAPSAGPKERRWMASLLFGVGWVVTAFLAPGLIRWLACFPAGLLALIGAIAMLDPISLLVRTAFTGEYALGSFIVFAVTVSGVGVSAPLWGGAAGLLIVRLAARRTKPTGDIERES